MSPRTRLATLALLVVLFALTPIPARAQGCALCQDNTAATTPATQRAYRHAIILMASAAGAFFLTTLILFKRQP